MRYQGRLLLFREGLVGDSELKTFRGNVESLEDESGPRILVNNEYFLRGY